MRSVVSADFACAVSVLSERVPSVAAMNDRTHLLAHVVVTGILAVTMLVAAWLCLCNGSI